MNENVHVTNLKNYQRTGSKYWGGIPVFLRNYGLWCMGRACEINF